MMKNRNPFLPITAKTLVFGACSKEDTNKQNLMATTEADPSSLVLGFKQKMEDHKNGFYFKSSDKIQIDSAIWYIDATLNYTYADAGHAFARMHRDTLYTEMSLVNDYEAAYEEVFDAYDTFLAGLSHHYYIQMIDEVRQIYYACDFEQKGLALINLQKATTTAESISFTVNVVTGEKTDNIPPQPVIAGPFGDEDNWWYGEMEGRCGEFLMNSDAARQLMMAMNASLPDSTVSNFYVINPVDFERKGGRPNVRRPNDPLDNNFDYYLFHASEAVGTVDLCLERNTMNAYYNHLRYLGLEKIKQDEGLGSMYSLIGITGMLGDKEEVFISGSYIWNYYHKSTFQYGIKVYYMDGGQASEL